MRIITPIIVLLFVISSCKTSQGTATNNATLELEGAFKISSLNGNDVSDKGLTFILDESTNRVSGNSGCNTYGGGYELSETNDIISFSMIFASKKYCAEQEKNDIERDYLQALSKSFRIILKKESIELEATDESAQRISLVRN